MSEKKSGHKFKIQDKLWVLAMGSEAGLLVAVPVLLGLAIGFLLDKNFRTLPIFTIVFTLGGTIAGPILVYRWVTTIVQKRLKNREEKE